jgi:hypothetical protein
LDLTVGRQNGVIRSITWNEGRPGGAVRSLDTMSPSKLNAIDHERKAMREQFLLSLRNGKAPFLTAPKTAIQGINPRRNQKRK